MNAAFSLIGFLLLSVGILVTLTRLDGVPAWATMAAGFVLAGLGVLFALRRFNLGDIGADPLVLAPDADPADAREDAPTAPETVVVVTGVPTGAAVVVDVAAPQARPADLPGTPTL